ncbi:MAG TPA: hypothetical protein VM287_05970 [Egibacteraceae bacterium]|nr:hypothetical protein [Egibacteraceae bacterium]
MTADPEGELVAAALVAASGDGPVAAWAARRWPGLVVFPHEPVVWGPPGDGNFDCSDWDDSGP